MEGTLNIRKSDTEMSVREISKESPEYPQKLLHYEGMPEILYVRGTLPDPRRPAVAIVGARAASPYGRMQAFRYARRLSEEGVQILSGMAYGIDTEAHRGALEGEGAHGRYLEMALISVILRVTEHFISEFCEKNVVYSVNSRRGRGQEIIFFRQETELSADWRILL